MSSLGGRGVPPKGWWSMSATFHPVARTRNVATYAATPEPIARPLLVVGLIIGDSGAELHSQAASSIWCRWSGGQRDKSRIAGWGLDGRFSGGWSIINGFIVR